MIQWHALVSGFTLLFQDPMNWILAFPGLLIGLFFGSVPGLSVIMALAIFLPVTFYMHFLPAIIFMMGMYIGSLFGSSIPAVLINIPGMAGSVATTFDGYPMTRKGQHNEALGLALTASVLGSLTGFALLLLAVKPLGLLGLHLGPPEMFMVILWGTTLIGTLRGRNTLRGLAAGFLGLLVATIGTSAMGVQRGTLGIPQLLDGVPVFAAMIGLFAAAELFNLIGKRYVQADSEKRRVSMRGILAGSVQSFKYWPTILRGGVIGAIIGAIPGVGAAVACLVSYGEAKRADRHPETFGTGNPKGVAASESANSSSEGGAMATMFALGLPGGGATAVMLGAFSLHGLTGGPTFISQHINWVYMVVFGALGQIVLLWFVGLVYTYFAARAVTLPTHVLVPSITLMALLGSYALTSSFLGPIVMTLFAVLGWWMKTYDYPVAGAVVGLILGKLAEGNLLRSYQLGGGNLTILFTRPISLALFLFIVGSTVWSMLRSRRAAGRRDSKPHDRTGANAE